MTLDQILSVAQNGSFLIFSLMLWWSERTQRIEAEKRERTLLRSMAQALPEGEV
jgi:hypothetical protein